MLLRYIFFFSLLLLTTLGISPSAGFSGFMPTTPNIVYGGDGKTIASSAAKVVAELGNKVVEKGVQIGSKKAIRKLTRSELKSIKSLEKQIQKHQQKLDDFKANPTVKPGMESLPKEVIKKQQEARIKHLETEINTFKNNIEKIKTGELYK